jgi:hypothetical protein
VVLIWVLSWILCLTVNNAHIFKQCFYKTRRQHLCLFIQLWIFYSWCHYLIFPFCMQSLVLCFCYMQDSGSCKEGHRWDAQGAVNLLIIRQLVLTVCRFLFCCSIHDDSLEKGISQSTWTTDFFYFLFAFFAQMLLYCT